MSPNRWLLVVMLAIGTIAEAADSSPLVDAVKRGDQAAVRALIEQRADVNRSEVDGTTPLHWAAHENQLEMADLLLRAGANATTANRYGVAAALPRVRQRKRGDDRAAPRRRRRRERRGSEGRDAAHDGGALRQRGGGQRAARSRRQRQRQGKLAWTDRADVGCRRGAHRGREGADRARRGRPASFEGRFHGAAVCRPRRPDRRRQDAARRGIEPRRIVAGGGARRRPAAWTFLPSSPRPGSTRSCSPRATPTTSSPPCSSIAAPIPTPRRAAGRRSTNSHGSARPASRAATIPLPKDRARMNSLEFVRDARGARRRSERARHQAAAGRRDAAEHDWRRRRSCSPPAPPTPST